MGVLVWKIVRRQYCSTVSGRPDICWHRWSSPCRRKSKRSNQLDCSIQILRGQAYSKAAGVTNLVANSTRNSFIWVVVPKNVKSLSRHSTRDHQAQGGNRDSHLGRRVEGRGIEASTKIDLIECFYKSCSGHASVRVANSGAEKVDKQPNVNNQATNLHYNSMCFTWFDPSARPQVCQVH